MTMLSDTNDPDHPSVTSQHKDKLLSISENAEDLRVGKMHATETRQAATETSQAATETRQAATETSQAETGTSQAATETRQSAIKTSQAATETSQAATETRQAETGTRQSAIKTSQAATGTSQAETETRQSATETSQAETETRQSAIKTSQAATGTSQAETETRQSATETSQAAIETRQAETGTRQSATKTSQAETGTSQAATETKQSAIKTSQAATETSQAATETSQAATETSQAATETSQAATETRQAETGTRQSAIKTSQAATGTSQAETETRQSATGTSQAATETRQSATKASQAATGTSQAATETRQSETETRQSATEEHRIQLRQANERLVITSIEAQKLAEQLQTTQAELESAKFVAEKASLAKSNFLSSMSHELRTPLNAILGFAQLLEVGSPPPTDVQMLRVQQIIKAGWYLLELINEILDLSVIESGKMALSLEPVSMVDLMRECQAMIEPQAQKSDIAVQFLPFDHSVFVNADRTRLKQALINLLSNAIKYNRAQGTVEVKCIVSTPDRIRISVKDSGAGLNAEHLLQLFQPFNRLGQESSAKEGTGIGLVVTKQLIELMGGTIGVESTVGVGSEFWIELMRDVAPQLTDRNLPVEIAPPAQKNAELHTLLYVEDNPANLMLVEHIIAAHPDVRMFSALNGTHGIELARIHLPDVILMDINLPGISGIEAMNILRNDPVTSHIPVMALSANAMLRDIEIGLEAGFFRYLTKPIKINEFMSALDDALKLSEMRSNIKSQ